MLLHKLNPTPATGEAPIRENAIVARAIHNPAIHNPAIHHPRSDLASCRSRLIALLADWASPRPVAWLPTAQPPPRETPIPAHPRETPIPAHPREDEIELELFDLEPSHDAAEAVSRGFAHVATYRVRPVDGVVLLPAAGPAACVARVQAAEGSFILRICSHWPAPPLPQGLLEQYAAAPPFAAAVAAVRSSPKTSTTTDTRLVALAERLMAMEEKLNAAHFQAAQLQHRLAQSWPASDGKRGDGAFDVPRERHEWRLAEQKDAAPESLGLYDRRVDDAVILEARNGEAFLTQWNLLADDAPPDFGGATRYLAGLRPVPRLDHDPPEVSIVIPIFGELAYTLSCVHSLLRQQTRHSLEIIVVDDASTDQSARFLSQIRHLRYHRQQRNGGFIAAANQGAALARGEYLVMLNNDTRVVAGWLDALIDGFALFPTAGLIGSKLHYDDGSLQEAGGIVWRDGSCWNYGRRDDPNRPQYSYARRVDYVSGCSIAIRTSLWRELHGFDPHYAPAYCEDVDLCLRLVERGYEVWYQPRSRVVHYEGKTSGTDTGSGVKAYQLVNTKKLYLRWRDRLLDHRTNGTAPFFERERKVNRRLLVVDAVAPTPKQDAGSVQTMLALKVAHDLGYKVHFVPEDNWLFEPDSIPDLQAMGIDCAYAPYELGFDNYLRRYGALFDVILVFRVTILERTIEAIEKYAPQATLLYHVADLFHLRLARQAELEDDPALRELAEKTKQRELELARRAHGTITHSLYEAQLLETLVPEAQVTVWPLMFDFFGTEVGFAPRRDICFLGGYRHPPNVDAVQYFVSQIWPLVADALDGARFIIAGANPTPDLLALAGPRVIVTGMIDDLRDLFDTVRVVAIPLRVGAGVKGKLASALSYGVPVVSTAIGFEGTGLEPEEQVLLGDTPEAFAAQLIRLYHDQDLWHRLSAAGQAVMRDRFSPSAGAAALATAIDRGTYRRVGVELPVQAP